MNKETMEVRHEQWENVIKQCHARPQGQTVTQWLAERGISARSYYYRQKQLRQVVFSGFFDNLIFCNIKNAVKKQSKK